MLAYRLFIHASDAILVIEIECPPLHDAAHVSPHFVIPAGWRRAPRRWP